MADADGITKQCRCCTQTKPVLEFYKQTKAKDGLGSYCILCVKENDKKRVNQDLLKIKIEKDNLFNSGLQKCSKCGTVKPLDAFGVNANSIHGVRPDCKECMKKFYDANREKLIARSKAYVTKNKEKVSEKSKERYHKNGDRNREMLRASYHKNRDKRIRYSKAYYELNKKTINEKNNERSKKRRREDAFYALKCSLRELLVSAFTRSGFSKSSRSHEIIGCDWEFLRLHIEKQFHKGMGWDNRSEWHLDHITPLATATTKEEVIALNHFTNLRPMWAKDNLSKGAQITHLI